MTVLGLDYGLARTGVAVSDPSGLLARPLGVVEQAGTAAGLDRIDELAREHGADRIVVGLPLTLAGHRGEQAAATEEFVAALRARTAAAVETWDERFTTALAARTPSAAPEDAVAAAHLLQSWLDHAARAAR